MTAGSSRAGAATAGSLPCAPGEAADADKSNPTLRRAGTWLLRSMPYAQQHYPFENKDKFERSFPADFVAEGLDQTRGWFYTLLVLATALFDKPAFKNLIVNGLVLASYAVLRCCLAGFGGGWRSPTRVRCAGVADDTSATARR